MRNCRFCQTVIPEDLHENRRFCPTPSQEEINNGKRNTKCKQRYNNNIKKEIRKTMDWIMMIHWNNYKILNTLYEKNEQSISLKELLSKGFKFQYVLFIHKDIEKMAYLKYFLLSIGGEKYTINKYD